MRERTEELVVSGIDSLVDGVDQSWKIDGDDNSQSHDSSPVDSSFVPVDTFVLVQHRNMQLPVSNKVVIGNLLISLTPRRRSMRAYNDSEQRSEDDNVSREESGQRLSGFLNLPRTSDPSTEERSKESTSSDVEVFREDEGEIVRCGDRVGGDVGTESS
jgi:hypothetical protein